jgi:lysozyme
MGGIRPAPLLARLLVPAALLCALAPSPASAVKDVRGVDVSRFQGRIDWEAVGHTRIGFAFVQASRGSGNDCTVAPRRCGPDKRYDENYRGARANRIRVGAYHRAFPSGHGIRSAKADAREEAGVFIARVGTLRRRDLLPVLDVEAPIHGLNEEELRAWVREWLDRVDRELGRRAIIYTNPTTWLATGDTTEFAEAGHPLWIANYGVDEPSVPGGFWGGFGWSVWQFTSSGHVRGIDGGVDLNRLSNGFRNIRVRDQVVPRRVRGRASATLDR